MLGVRVDLESDFFPITTLFAFARPGDTLLFAVSAAVMSAPDAALVENVLRTMVERA